MSSHAGHIGKKVLACDLVDKAIVETIHMYHSTLGEVEGKMAHDLLDKTVFPAE